jgi:hypothetical protein
MSVEFMPLSELATWPGNPKAHDEEVIDASLGRFGYVEPIMLDETTKRIVAGHGRRNSLIERKASGEAPPERVELREDGEWLVPIVRGVGFKSEIEAEAYLLTSNQSTIRSGYHDGLLAEMLGRHEDLTGLGWSQDDIDALLKRASDLADAPPIEAPDDFREYDEGEKPGHDCPQCGFRVTCDR